MKVVFILGEPWWCKIKGSFSSLGNVLHVTFCVTTLVSCTTDIHNVDFFNTAFPPHAGPSVRVPPRAPPRMRLLRRGRGALPPAQDGRAARAGGGCGRGRTGGGRGRGGREGGRGGRPGGQEGEGQKGEVNLHAKKFRKSCDWAVFPTTTAKLSHLDMLNLFILIKTSSVERRLFLISSNVQNCSLP